MGGTWAIDVGVLVPVVPPTVPIANAAPADKPQVTIAEESERNTVLANNMEGKKLFVELVFLVGSGIMQGNQFKVTINAQILGAAVH